MLPPTNRTPVPLFLNKAHYDGSARKSAVRVPGSRAIRVRESGRNLCACSSCQQMRGADRTALIAKVAAEKSATVADWPSKKREITAESLAAQAAIRRKALRRMMGTAR